MAIIASLVGLILFAFGAFLTFVWIVFPFMDQYKHYGLSSLIEDVQWWPDAIFILVVCSLLLGTGSYLAIAI